jgi:hypothetical protein
MPCIFAIFVAKIRTMAKQKSIELLEPILIETFGLERIYQATPLLADWLSAKGEINEMDMSILEESRAKLIENADSWNEEELKMQFISFVIFLARFNKPIRTYYDREISAEINEIYVSSKVDMMLSKGIGELIKTPYFFLHEYKREKKYSGDPIGQMLGGMLIGQAKNNDDKPIYGCYVQGRNWYFSLMEGKKYVISKGFDSSEIDEVKQIIYILRKLKLIIDERMKS